MFQWVRSFWKNIRLLWTITPHAKSLVHSFKEWRYFARQGIPVFLNKNNALCLKLGAGVNADPVIIVSVPKSGTYLFAELLSAVGVQNLDIHIAAYGFQDLRYSSKEFAIFHSAEAMVMVPSEKVLPLVRPGQFLVSHFPCNQEIVQQLKGFKIIFTYRNLRDVFVSLMRWVAKKEGWERWPDGPPKMEYFLEKYGRHYLDNIRIMRDWVLQPHVLCLSFEEIQGDFGVFRQTQTVQRILDYLNISLPSGEIPAIVKKCLGKETVTFSGKRSSRKDVWSDKVEQFFTDNGVDELEAFWKSHLDGLEERKQTA